jgi:hypothetical protein
MISTTYGLGVKHEREQNDHDLHPIRTHFTVFTAPKPIDKLENTSFLDGYPKVNWCLTSGRPCGIDPRPFKITV